MKEEKRSINWRLQNSCFMALLFLINSNEKYVWPYAKGNDRGQAIEPLFNPVVEASLKDKELYELLTMVDAIRVGKIREKEIAKKELEKRILNAQ
jgi:hypothetical protein